MTALLAAARLACLAAAAPVASQPQSHAQASGADLASDGPEREAAALGQTLLHTREPLEAAAAVLSLEQLLPELGHLPVLQQALELAAERPSLSGEAAALAGQLGVQVLRARGRPERAVEQARELGLVQSAAVLGPLDWNATQPCGSGGPVPWPSGTPVDGKPWRAFQELAPAGTFNLDDLVSDRRDVATVIAFSVKLAHPARAALYYGSSAPSALALNGRWIAADPSRHPAHFGQLRVPVQLPAGDSVFALQVCRAERPLQVALRLADERGRPLSGATLAIPALDRPPPAGSPHRAGDPGKVPTPERGGLLLAKLDRAGGDAGRSPALATVIEGLVPFDDQEHRPARARELACRAAPTVACFLQLARDDEQIGDRAGRRGALDSAARALANTPGDALARESLELAETRYAADLGYPDRALSHAKAAAALEPNDSRAALALAQALEGFGMTGLAGQIELAAAEHWPEAPEVLGAASYRNERLHREEEAIRLLRRTLALRDDLLGSHEALQRLLLHKGDLTGALDQLAALHRLAPSSARSYLEEGKLLLANLEPSDNASGKGNPRHEQAEAAFAVALSLAPSDPDVLGELAGAELRAGALSRGHDLLRTALALAPQAPNLRALAESDASPRQSLAADGLAGELRDLRATAAAVPPTPGADAVSLAETTVVKVYPSGLSSRWHQSILRVQTQRGAQAARTVPIAYSPERQELHIESAQVLKPDGDLVPSYQEENRSLSEPWYDLYYDLREDDLTFPGLAPGDVLEVTYRLDDSARENLLAQDFGDFVFLQDSIERKRFDYTVLMPPGRSLFDNHPKLPGFEHRVERRADGSAVHRFSARDLPRLESEPEMPGYAEVSPTLHVSTQDSWAAIGDYFWSLAKDQLAPTPALREAARTVAAQVGSDPASRVAAAYDLVVSRTRYVGLEFGIHGYKPYPVGEVLARGFGDCKDKASLLVALLRELGIPANLVLVRTRRLGRIEDHPASLAVFDHAIAYVPSLDLFLDGTARFYGSRELPSEDQGASVLLVEPGGQSRLVVTPVAAAGSNLTDTELTFELAADGSAHIAGTSQVSGELAPEYRRAYASDVGRKSAFEAAWSRSYPGLSVEQLRFSDLNLLERPVELSFALTAPKLSRQRGEFRPFGLISGYLETYAPLSRRQFDLQLSFPFATRFHYLCRPSGAGQLSGPPNVALKSPFGNLSIQYQPQGNGLLVVGELSLAAGRIAAQDYPEFRKFLRQVDLAFEAPLALAATGSDHAQR